MKTLMDVPRPEDWYETDILDITDDARHQLLTFDKSIRYLKHSVNFRNVLDYGQKVIELNVINESMYPEYEKALKEWEEKRKSLTPFFGSSQKPEIVRPVEGPLASPFAEIKNNPEVETDLGSQIDFSDNYANRPEIPVRKAILKCTKIMYFNSVQYLLMDDYFEFKKLYMEWSKKLKLDI